MIGLVCVLVLSQSSGEKDPSPPAVTTVPAEAMKAAPAKTSNLLVGLPAPRAEKTANSDRITDGKAADPGDNWQTFLTSVIEKEGFVIWDFGAPRDWEGAWVQADNNDVYILSVSDDGTNFTTAWESPTVDNPGMQLRSSTTARGHGRYLRLSAKGGDGSFSVSELAVFEKGDEAKAFTPTYVRTAPPPQCGDLSWAVIGIALAGVVMLVRRMRAPEQGEGPPPPAS